MRAPLAWLQLLCAVILLASCGSATTPGASKDCCPTSTDLTPPTTLPDGTIVVTLSNNSESLPAHIGTTIDVDLKLYPGDDGYKPPRSTAPELVAPLTNSAPNTYEQHATFRVMRVGQAQIRALPPPPAKCLPQCRVNQYNIFWVTIIVK